MEKKFGLPMAISANAKDWADGKITVDEFIGMLRKNGNLKDDSGIGFCYVPLNGATAEWSVSEHMLIQDNHNPYQGYGFLEITTRVGPALQKTEVPPAEFVNVAAEHKAACERKIQVLERMIEKVTSH